MKCGSKSEVWLDHRMLSKGWGYSIKSFPIEHLHTAFLTDSLPTRKANPFCVILKENQGGSSVRGLLSCSAMMISSGATMRQASVCVLYMGSLNSYLALALGFTWKAPTSIRASQRMQNIASLCAMAAFTPGWFRWAAVSWKTQREWDKDILISKSGQREEYRLGRTRVWHRDF